MPEQPSGVAVVEAPKTSPEVKTPISSEVAVPAGKQKAEEIIKDLETTPPPSVHKEMLAIAATPAPIPPEGQQGTTRILEPGEARTFEPGNVIDEEGNVVDTSKLGGKIVNPVRATEQAAVPSPEQQINQLELLQTADTFFKALDRLNLSEDQRKELLKLAAENPELMKQLPAILSNINPAIEAPQQTIEQQEQTVQNELEELESVEKPTEEQKKRLSLLRVLLIALGIALAAIPATFVVGGATAALAATKVAEGKQ